MDNASMVVILDVTAQPIGLRKRNTLLALALSRHQRPTQALNGPSIIHLTNSIMC